MITILLKIVRSTSIAFLYAVISGILLICAYPPVGFGFLAYVSLVPLLFIVCGSKKLNRVFLWSFISGLIFHFGTLFWIKDQTWIGMILAVIILAFFFSLPFVITRFIYDNFNSINLFRSTIQQRIVRSTDPRAGIIVFPFALAGIEWIRSFDVLAFPWMIIGNSQTYYPWLIQFADITSAYGVSWWVAMVNVSIFFLIKRRTAVRWVFLVLLFLFPLIYSLKMRNIPANSDNMLKVALIQGNVTPEEKWGNGNLRWNMNLYLNMSIDAMAYNPDFIIWPETATPVYLCENPRYRRIVQSLADSLNVPILTGTPSIDYETREKWNSAAFFKPGEEKVEIYKKIHLVPFGEAFPLDDIFPSLRNIHLGQANWDEGNETVIFNSSVLRSITTKDEPELPPFTAVICFESIFPDLVRKFVVKGAQFIVVITNDVWDGPVYLPMQHAMISVLRAIEFHMPVVRCANTGISMIIDPYGRVVNKTETFVRDILIGDIIPGTKMTVYAKFGNIFSMFCLSFTLVSLIISVVMKYVKPKRNL